MTKTQTSGSKPRRMAREPKSEAPVAEQPQADETSGDAAPVTPPVGTTPEKPAAPKTPSKQSVVIELLRRKNGALLAGIVEATGWLPHTARAMLTGLKKQGHAVQSAKVDKVTRYSLS